MLVISCHADTGFREHRLEKLAGDIVCGHLDNFAGVHAVMLAYFSGGLPTQGVRIELTHGEEVDFAGAYEVRTTLRGWDVVLVVDVTGTPTDKDIVIEKCVHPKLRELIEQALAGMEYDLYPDCPDPVCDLDETDVYRDACPMTCFVGVPVSGGDYNSGVVSCKERSIQSVAQALCRIGQAWARSMGLDPEPGCRMAAVVSLREVADEMEVCIEGCHAFLNRRTGELYGGSDDCLAAAEEDDDEGLLGWEQEIVARLREVLASDDWVKLPRQDPVEDYRIMEGFCLEQVDGEAQDDLLDTIQGRGAFRRFKISIQQWRLVDKWHRYRHEATLREAAAWLESLGIPYRK